MYHRVSKEQQATIDKIYDGLSLDERIAHTFAVNLTPLDVDEAKRAFEKCPFGAGFFGYRHVKDTRAIMDALQAESEIPVLGCADLVNGAGSRLEGATLFPWQMAVGAADSQELAEKMGRATAIEGREAGIHWTFGPIVDLSINKDNSMMHTRTFGEGKEHVLRISQAFIRGVQRENRMAATAKHFPGDGVDDRDSHVCTSINPLSKEEWYESFGYVWKNVVGEAAAVMSGHIALPWIDPAKNYLGPPPATLSAPIQIELLRNQLGFQGLVVSDAIVMIGFSGFAGYRDRLAANIETGSDMILWPDVDRDVEEIKRAMDEGKLSEKQLSIAVKNVLGMKAWLGLLDGKEPPEAKETKADFQLWAEQIGEQSVSIVRNEGSVLPLKLESGAKVATVTLRIGEDTRGYIKELSVVDEELRARGLEVTHLDNPSSAEMNKRASEFDAVFINLHIMPVYGTTRFMGKAVQSLWNSFWHEHASVVFTSFGDPYKLYEMPYCHNFVMTYSNTPSSQRAVVKVWLGELEAKGKLPVTLPGFFEREV
ncbi:MAG: glycoside hydrolase family 3 protein [Spirochaetales bacterium]